MDSLSQIVLGGAVAAAIAPPAHRRAALLAGAALGTLPDLDGLLIARFTSDPIQLMTLHRGASHSLLVLPWVAAFLWWCCRRLGGRVAAAPRRWFWVMQAVLITHPLLDAFTAERALRYEFNRNESIFGRGWYRRLLRMHQLAWRWTP